MLYCPSIMDEQRDRLEREIEGIGDRRVLGCAVKVALAAVAGGLLVFFVVRQSEDAATRLAVMLAVSGLLFGFATSYLAARMRRLLQVVFATAPVAVAAAMFAMRTILGWSEELPLRLAAAPLAISVGFLLGGLRRSD